MKVIQIYIYGFLFFCLVGAGSTYASTDKNESTSAPSRTEHPPHDHQEPDHIKKLDEGMRKKRKDEEESH